MLQKFLTSSSIFHLLFPHVCVGCGGDGIDQDSFLCLECINDLPHTNYAMHAHNPAEKIFYGRVHVHAVMSQFYFTKESIIQNLIHEFKYKGNREIGKYLGNLMGKSIQESFRFQNISAIIPLPLYIGKEKKRGFNQAAILCKGIEEITQIPLMENNVVRIVNTETQTKKRRIQRWLNVDKTFDILYPHLLEGKHVLLVDDVITTGATLEACVSALLKVKSIKVSIATLAIASD